MVYQNTIKDNASNTNKQKIKKKNTPVPLGWYKSHT